MNYNPINTIATSLVKPLTMKSDYIATILKDFNNAAATVMHPAADAFVAKNIDQPDSEMVEGLDKFMNELWTVLSQSGLLTTKVMYYTGDAPEHPEIFECMEITGINTEAETHRVSPVWNITPQKPDHIVVDGIYMGKCGDCFSFIKFNHREKSIIVLDYLESEADRPAKILVDVISEALVREFLLKNDDRPSVHRLAILRAYAMGLIELSKEDNSLQFNAV